MRVISYNILNGGEGRADPLAEVILAQRADVVALVEADVPAVVDRIARRLDMDYVVGRGGSHASALLSRWPIRRSVNHAAIAPAITRSFLEAVVLSPMGQEWPIGVLHLPAQATERAEDARICELAVALDRIKGHRVARRPHLICGDFNSNAPYQRIDPARCKVKTQEALAANGNRLPRRVVEAMTGVGYLDTYHVLHDEGQELVGSFTTQRPGQRVDYIFAFAVSAHRVRDAWVERDRLAKYASDHFPVGAEIMEDG
jgi:endonuclease/exonuclease/phosphatase family metal-dependent hydrolase